MSDLSLASATPEPAPTVAPPPATTLDPAALGAATTSPGAAAIPAPVLPPPSFAAIVASPPGALPIASLPVAPGSTVEIEDLGSGHQTRYKIVHSHEANPRVGCSRKRRRSARRCSGAARVSALASIPRAGCASW